MYTAERHVQVNLLDGTYLSQGILTWHVSPLVIKESHDKISKFNSHSSLTVKSSRCPSRKAHQWLGSE